MGAMEVEIVISSLGNFPIWFMLGILTLREIVNSDLLRIPVPVKQRNFVRKPVRITKNISRDLETTPNLVTQRKRRSSDCRVPGCEIHPSVQVKSNGAQPCRSSIIIDVKVKAKPTPNKGVGILLNKSHPLY